MITLSLTTKDLSGRGPGRLGSRPSNARLLSPPCKQDQIAVRVAHDERPSAPGFRFERLREKDAGDLIFKEQWFRIVECDRCRKQLLAVSNLWIKARLVEAAEIQTSAVAEYLSVERWLAVAEGYREPEFLCVKLAGGHNISDEKLGLSS